MKALRIKQWNPLYEKADTRKTDYMGWYCKQTKMVGIGIGKTMREPYPRNAVLYGLWTMIEIMASQSAVAERGWLIRGGVPLDAEAMADLHPTIPPSAFQEAIDWFLQAKIGWLELVECPLLSDKSPELFPAKTPETTTPQEAAGKSSQSVPTPQEAAGRNSATERETERELTDREKREREALTLAAARASAPSPDEVETWAVSLAIPAAFALEKLREGLEREDFAKAPVRKNWQSRFARFWSDDSPAWLKKNQKNAAAQNGGAAGRPDDWMPGDATNWWTDPVVDVRSAMAGAARLGDKKTAARLGDIIKLREGKK